jgi:hypothetical protein
VKLSTFFSPDFVNFIPPKKVVFHVPSDSQISFRELHFFDFYGPFSLPASRNPILKLPDSWIHEELGALRVHGQITFLVCFPGVFGAPLTPACFA